MFGWPVADFVFQRKLGLDMLKAATGAALFELTRQWRLSLVQPLKKTQAFRARELQTGLV